MGIRHALDDVRFMRVLFPAAEREAAALGDEQPGPEHLLLGALSVPDDSTARDALTAVHATPESIRAAIGRVHADALSALDIATDAGLATSSSAGSRRLEGPYRSTGSAQEVFRRAVALSKEDTSAVLRAAHVVLAVAEQEHGTVARVLGALGIDRQALTAAARTALAGRPS